MGWKNIKKHFGITHLVCVEDGHVLIGSGYIRDLIKINVKTGKLVRLNGFESFLDTDYPKLATVQPQDFLDLWNKPDFFEDSIDVYTCVGGRILEKQCEALGWPNVTHDGVIMHNNSFFPTVAQAVEHAKNNAAHSVLSAQRHLKRVQSELDEIKERLTQRLQDCEDLQRDHPETAMPVFVDEDDKA